MNDKEFKKLERQSRKNLKRLNRKNKKDVKKLQKQKDFDGPLHSLSLRAAGLYFRHR